MMGSMRIFCHWRTDGQTDGGYFIGPEGGSKKRHGSGTGGGCAKKLSEADDLCLRIMGENNPKMCNVPGSIHNTSLQLPVPLVPNASSSSSSSRAPQAVNSSATTTTTTSKRDRIDALHEEVLTLQKEKLKLKIKKLRQETVYTADKGVQFGPYAYDSESDNPDENYSTFYNL